LRWLYARRKPNQSFKIAFDQEIHPPGWDRIAAAARRRAPRGGQPSCPSRCDLLARDTPDC
ncbi:hypothetical protein, partial [Streptomyces toxytricini]|uniref:hypothetical protein n=1 Tax=Streptomyces toxytricini TaxID=67369 RepID=UPI00342BC9AF